MPEQQSVATLHLPPTSAQAQRPLTVSQLPPQQSVLSAQAPPTGLQAHLPFWQRRRQQSPSLLQLLPDGVQSQVPKPAAVQRPLQQSVLALQKPLGGPQQTPSAHTRPLLQVTLVQPPPLGTQVSPMRVKLASHTKSQTPPLHVGEALAGGAHGVQELPHDCGLALARQRSPQTWKPASQVMSQTLAAQVA
jgi:hypothetical protein